MADEIQAFQVTTPIGVSADSPLTTSLTMPPRIVKAVEIVIPEGCNGALGFALGAAGQNIIPYNAGAWIVGSGETLRWDMDKQINSGAWQVQSWNVGKYPHTLYVRFLVNYVVALELPPEIAPTPLPALTTMTVATMNEFFSAQLSDGFGV